MRSIASLENQVEELEEALNRIRATCVEHDDALAINRILDIVEETLGIIFD
jgi:hypothetical protein